MEGRLSMTVMNHLHLVPLLKINKNGRCVQTLNLADGKTQYPLYIQCTVMKSDCQCEWHGEKGFSWWRLLF